jgi:hypothetical protein
MEIERNVKIQILEGEEDPKGNFVAGFSSGPHASRKLPHYSKAERATALGRPVVDRIRAVFASARTGRQFKSADTSAVKTVPFRDGW